MFLSVAEEEKRYLSVIESNLRFYNGSRRKKVISIHPYISDGNRLDVKLDDCTIASCLSIRDAHNFIFGIVAYADRVGLVRR